MVTFEPTSELLDDIRQYVLDSRGVDRHEMVTDIRLFAQLGCDWPRLTIRDWNKAIDATIQAGLVVESRKDFLVPATTLGETESQGSEGQLELF